MTELVEYRILLDMDISANDLRRAAVVNRIVTALLAQSDFPVDVHQFNDWNLAQCVKQVKNKWGTVLVERGEYVIYDPTSFSRYPNHHLTTYRKRVFVTIYAERGLTDVGCRTSMLAKDFDFLGETPNIQDREN